MSASAAATNLSWLLNKCCHAGALANVALRQQLAVSPHLLLHKTRVVWLYTRELKLSQPNRWNGTCEVFQLEQRRRTWSYIVIRQKIATVYSLAVTYTHIATHGRGYSRYPAISTLVFVSFFASLRTPLHTSVFAAAQRCTADTQPSEHDDRLCLAYNISAAGNRYAGCLTHYPGRIGTLMVVFGHTDGTLHCCAPICLPLVVYATSVLPSCHSH
jgi:hypothetical protein